MRDICLNKEQLLLEDEAGLSLTVAVANRNHPEMRSQSSRAAPTLIAKEWRVGWGRKQLICIFLKVRSKISYVSLITLCIFLCENQVMSDELSNYTDLHIIDRSYVNDTLRDLELLIPSRYRVSYKGRVQDIAITTWLPSFGSIGDSINADRDALCSGYCNGRVTVEISLNSVYNNRFNKNYVELQLISDRKRYASWPIADVKVLPNDGVYDTGMRVTTQATPPHKDLDPGLSLPVKEFLYHFAKNNDDFNIRAECDPLQAYPSCSIVFLLSCKPGVIINVYGLPYQQNKDYVQEAYQISKWIGSMTTSTECSAPSK